MRKIIRESFPEVYKLQLDNRINVTQFSRGTAWKKRLNEEKVLEILDRNETAGILFSKEAYQSYMAYVEKLEEEQEQRQLEEIVDSRENMTDWSSGEDLNRKAIERFAEKSDRIKRSLQDDK